MKLLFLLTSLVFVGCASKLKLIEQNKKIVADYYAAYNRQDLAGQVALMSSSVVHHSNSDKTEIGAENYRKSTEGVYKDVKEEVYDIHFIVDLEAKNVVAQSRVRGEYIGSLKGFPKAQGQKYDLPLAEFFEIIDGRITKLTTYYNELSWEEQVKNKK